MYRCMSATCTAPTYEQLTFTNCRCALKMKHIPVSRRIAVVVRLIHLQSSSSTLCCTGERSNTPSGRNCWYRNVHRTIKFNTVDVSCRRKFRRGSSIPRGVLVTCCIYTWKIDIGRAIKCHTANRACCFQFRRGVGIPCQRPGDPAVESLA
ncbi:hypothetical protein UMNF18_pP7021 (plasmid) [Escherichia coli UMNF18]|nr:hypothetical protein UMNF18_pP7021 [Escherichia coli UMNF18]